jgi:NAD(P)-dependent dehydrogenase (short-subunit alcohol dehydrogenase family)
MDLRIKDKKAIVNGGSGDLGKGSARALAGEGVSRLWDETIRSCGS